MHKISIFHKKTLIFLLVCSIVVCLAAKMAAAQETQEGPLIGKDLKELLSSGLIRPSKPPDYTVFHINKFWLQARKFLDEKDYDRAYEKINLIIQVKLQNGIRNLPTFSQTIIRESRKALLQKDYEASYQLAQLARKLSPDYSFPFVALAEAKKYYNGGFKGLVNYFNIYQQARMAIFDNFFEKLDFYVNLFSMLAIAFYFTCACFAVIIMLKSFRLWKHDLTHLMQGKLPSAMISIIMLLVLLLPVLFNLGFIWLLILWFFIFGGYLTLKEKVVCLLFFASLAGLPYLLNLAFSAALAAHHSPVKAIVQVNESKADNYIERELYDWMGKDPENEKLIFCLARTYRTEGKADLAEKYYQDLIDMKKLQAYSLNNLGNIYFYRGDHDKASTYYEKAIAADKTLASAFFNLGQVLHGKFEFPDGEKRFSRARQLDRQLFDYYNNFNSSTQVAIQIDEILPQDVIWESLLKPDDHKQEVIDNFLSGYLKAIGHRRLIFLSVPLLVLFIYLFILRKFDWARACKNCGKPVCKKCMISTGSTDYCLPCHRIYVEKMEIDPHIKIEKRKQISSSQSKKRWLTILGNLLIPGAGNLYRDKTFLGFIFMFLFTFFTTRIILWDGIFIHLNNTFQLKTTYTLIFLGVLMVLVYLTNFWVGQRK